MSDDLTLFTSTLAIYSADWIEILLIDFYNKCMQIKYFIVVNLL